MFIKQDTPASWRTASWRTGDWRIAIAGFGISGFATLGHLITRLRTQTDIPVHIYLFQPERTLHWDNLTPAQRSRLTQLQALGRQTLMGGGQVYDPAQPSLFTFNGSSAARGFDFVRQRHNTTDYFNWMQANRELLAALYPDFSPEQGRRRHPTHTLDDLHGSSPRGAYGLYLDDQFRALLAHLPNHLTVQVIPQAVRSFVSLKQGIYLQAATASYRVNQLVCATGHRFASIRPAWLDRVFAAYPCDRYRINSSARLTVVGAGPAGIETALHALHDLDVQQVTLVSRRGYSRLPQMAPVALYDCPWLTQRQLRRSPTAERVKYLLQRSLTTAYQVCGLPYPGWDALLHIDDYGGFLTRYLQQATPDHPLARLVRPVMSFYGKVQDLLPVGERVKVLQLLSSVKHLFATQSLACAELMLAAMRTGRLTLEAGTFLFDHETPTIRRPDGAQWQPSQVILATGFATGVAPIYHQAIHQGTALVDANGDLVVNAATGALVNSLGEDTACYQVAGASLSSVDQQAAKAAQSLAQQIGLAERLPVERVGSLGAV
ncbi:MAG: FAD/NAD(P)-binding protein [Leptolyngbyaceae cyanobacterium MO_188.B28]|nr:FAD/NAD(P)-binding protein [Leptolyngbyaceae cyanobacterium MO_188.B28]